MRLVTLCIICMWLVVASAESRFDSNVPVNLDSILVEKDSAKNFSLVSYHVMAQHHFQRGALEKPEIKEALQRLIDAHLQDLSSRKELKEWLEVYGAIWLKFGNNLVFEEARFWALKWASQQRRSINRILLEKSKAMPLNESDRLAIQNYMNLEAPAFPLDRIFLSEGQLVVPPKAQSVLRAGALVFQKNPAQTLAAVLGKIKGGQLSVLQKMAAEWNEQDIKNYVEELEQRKSLNRVTNPTPAL